MRKIQMYGVLGILLLCALHCFAQPKSTPAEQWKRFEQAEAPLIKLENDKSRALEEAQEQIEQDYRQRRDKRTDKRDEETYQRQLQVRNKFDPLITQAIQHYQLVLAECIEEEVRVPLKDNKLPTILHKESAKYTEEARLNKTQGIVILSVLFQTDGKVTDIQLVRGLPDGLTEKAYEAAVKMAFRPAIKQQSFVAVRKNLEFLFKLY